MPTPRMGFPASRRRFGQSLLLFHQMDADDPGNYRGRGSYLQVIFHW
ncbi:hypothetical protein HQ563_13850 [bacterium]|nr:hypothetical protein [bacterium]